MLVGNTNYEKGFYENLARQRGETLPANFRPPERDGCSTHVSALSYRKAGLPSWRYLYSGVWGNDTAPGAGHGARGSPLTTDLRAYLRPLRPLRQLKAQA